MDNYLLKACYLYSGIFISKANIQIIKLIVYFHLILGNKVSNLYIEMFELDTLSLRHNKVLNNMQYV